MVQIDNKNHLLRVNLPLELSPLDELDSTTVPFRFVHPGLIVCDVFFNNVDNKPATAMIDLGSVFTIVNKHTVKDIVGVEMEKLFDSSKNCAGIDGKSCKMKRVSF